MFSLAVKIVNIGSLLPAFVRDHSVCLMHTLEFYECKLLYTCTSVHIYEFVTKIKICMLEMVCPSGSQVRFTFLS